MNGEECVETLAWEEVVRYGRRRPSCVVTHDGVSFRTTRWTDAEIGRLRLISCSGNRKLELWLTCKVWTTVSQTVTCYWSSRRVIDKCYHGAATEHEGGGRYYVLLWAGRIRVRDTSIIMRNRTKSHAIDLGNSWWLIQVDPFWWTAVMRTLTSSKEGSNIPI